MKMTPIGNLERLKLTLIVVGLFFMVVSTFLVYSIAVSMSQNLGYIGFGITLEIIGLGLIILGKR